MEQIPDLENKNLLEMLEFEQQIFLDILHKDGLVISAKGLNIDVLFTNLLKVYNDPGNLIIILNYSDYDEKFYIEQLDNEEVYSTSLNVNEREERYLMGGIHFVSTRILVVDLLKNRIPIEKITGIFVLRAHTVLESCQEAFCLRLYRQNNKTGFIKAFSNCAENFTIGFGHVERIMRALFVKELYIWPRFHALVRQNLKKYEPTVVELHIPISSTMKNIQTCILDLMNNLVKELKRINKTLEMQEITVENCVSKKFHKILQAQLDCIWYQLSSKSKQIIADLKTLRYLILILLYNDSVTFHSVVSQYRKLEYVQSCTWTLFESAEQLFSYSNSYIFTGEKEFNPEFCPKWNALSELLKIEIPNETQNDELPKVLILCQDSRTCFQLNQYLTYGPQKYLFLMALKHDVRFKRISKSFSNETLKVENLIKELDKTLTKESPDKPKKPKLEKKTEDSPELDNFLQERNKLFENIEEDFENTKSCYILTMSQLSNNTKEHSDNEGDKSKENIGNESKYTFEPFPEMENMDLTKIEKNDPLIMIQTFKNEGNVLSLQKTLNEMQPNFIIMYHSNMTAIRQIEIFEARQRKTKRLKVYFLVYTGSVEEQSYLTTLRREKQAFEYLIETKSTMVVPEYQDGKSEETLSLQREVSSPVKNTRHGGRESETPVKKIIIVDMREFRSDLPALIHKRGIDIEPVTITIGDYILTPEICVERKSISDLIGSLNSGRLYQQCTQMTRYYAKPMLLIEFDQNRPFKLQSNYMVSNDTNGIDIQKKLQLLTLHFPKLKIVWSPSPYASAQLFEELKEGKEQPSAEYAAAVGSDSDTDIILKKYNSLIYDFIQKLPGITSKNIDAFLRNTKSLDSVIKMTEEELKTVLGNANDAKAFYSILHEKHSPKDLEQNKKVLTLLYLLQYSNGENFQPTQSKWHYIGYHNIQQIASIPGDNSAAIWAIDSDVYFQRFEQHIVLKLENVKTLLYNGPQPQNLSIKHMLKDIPSDASDILKPLVIYHKNKSNYTIAHEPDDEVWSVNMKRAIVNAMILNNENMENITNAKHQSLYGHCLMNYTVFDNTHTIKVEKFIDLNSCDNSPEYSNRNKKWSPRSGQHHSYERVLKYVQYYNEARVLKEVKTEFNITYKSMPDVKSIQNLFQGKSLYKVSTTNEFEPLDTTKNTILADITFDYSKGLEGGREENKQKKSQQELFEEFDKLFNIFKITFESTNLLSNSTVSTDVIPKLFIPKNNLNETSKPNEEILEEVRKFLKFYSKDSVRQQKFNLSASNVISDMYYTLYDLEEKDLEALEQNIFYKNDSFYHHTFLSLLPYLGTKDSVKYIKTLIENDDESLNDLLAIKILSTFPIYVENPNEELLIAMKPLMNLEKVENPQIQYTAILSFASLVKTSYANNKITDDKFKKYTQLYLNKFKGAQKYELKMTYLLGLINLDASNTEDIIGILTNTKISYHLRVLGIFGFKNSLKSSENIFNSFWPVVKNKNEHYEVRNAALDLLLYSNLKEEQFNSIIKWYNEKLEDPDERQLLHYLYTTIQALDESTGYYNYLGSMATEALKTMKPTLDSNLWTNGNYRMAFTDTNDNFGGSLQARFISNPRTNVISTALFSLDNYGLSLQLDSYTIYIKFHNIPDMLFELLTMYSRDNDEPVEDLVNLIQKHSYKFKEIKDVHIEVVIFCDDRVVFGIHINEYNIESYANNALLMDLIQLLIDYNSLSFPLWDNTYLISDLGSTIKITHRITEISSYELESIENILNIYDDDDIVFELNLKYSSKWSYLLFFECYNSLVTTGASTYKYIDKGMSINIPYSFNFTDFVFKWKHTDDMFSLVHDYKLGSVVDEEHLLKTYCPDCPTIIEIDVGEIRSMPDIFEPIGPILGVAVKSEVNNLGKAQTYLLEENPMHGTVFDEIGINHRVNSYCPTFAKPLLLLWHLQMYTTFLYPDLKSLVIKTEPYYNETTETVLDLEIDMDYIKNDQDPIDNDKFDFSIMFTTRKSDNAEVLSTFNMSCVFKTLSASGDPKLQPHLEHNYNIKLYYFVSSVDYKQKVCIDRNVLYPNRRTDKFSLDPVDPTKVTINVTFGDVKSIDDLCPTNYSFTVTEIYSPTEEQQNILKSLNEYGKCKEQSKNLKFIPPTKECIISHNTISRYDFSTLYLDFHEVEMNRTSEYGVKVAEYHRINNTHALVDISKEILKLTGSAFSVFLPEKKIMETDLSSMLSFNPATVAYDDADLKAGLCSACYITPKDIRTFRGHVISNYQSNDVAFVECVNVTQSGLTVQKLDDHTVGFRFWFGNNTLVVDVKDGKPSVIFNGEQKDSTDIKDDDLRIYFLDENVIYVTNGLVDIQYTTEYIVIKIISIYNNHLCGICSDDHL